jgi:hypothetical protein
MRYEFELAVVTTIPVREVNEGGVLTLSSTITIVVLLAIVDPPLLMVISMTSRLVPWVCTHERLTPLGNPYNYQLPIVITEPAEQETDPGDVAADIRDN